MDRLPAHRFHQEGEPTPKAKFVKFTTLDDPNQMPGQNESVLPWPYVEGLRMDEAMHPLTLLVLRLYGRGAAEPGRRAAAADRAVEVRLQEHQVDRQNRASPRSSRLTPGIARCRTNTASTANVNPKVDHPRWSQASERRIGAPFLAARRPTLPFNGYADEVASLYHGMDLRKYF